MSNLTLSGWKTSTTTLLVTKLPLQTYESGFVLVENYLSSTGGWVPDDPNDPVGSGVPASGATPDQAVATIVTNQYGQVYHFNLNIGLTVSTDYHANLSPGQTASSALAAIEAQLRTYVQDQIKGSNLIFVTMDNYNGTVEFDGYTTAAERVQIENDLSKPQLSDPRAIGVSLARQRFSLDITWNCYSLYVEDSQPIVVIVRKYTDQSYQSLESTTTYQYVLTLDPLSYSLETGLKINI